MKQAGWDGYALEQLGHIVNSLVSSGSLEQRLSDIAGTRIAFIQPDMVPEAYRVKVEEIQNRLDQGEPQAKEGSYAAAIAAMDESERVQLATDLLNLWAECTIAWRGE